MNISEISEQVFAGFSSSSSNPFGFVPTCLLHIIVLDVFFLDIPEISHLHASGMSNIPLHFTNVSVSISLN